MATSRLAFACVFLASAAGCVIDRFELRGGQKLLVSAQIDPSYPYPTMYLSDSGQIGWASGWCIPDLQVLYQHTPFLRSTASELHLFARDPVMMAHQLQELTDDAIRQGAWTENTSVNLLPPVVTIPFPPNSKYDPATPVTLALTEQEFWVNPPPASAYWLRECWHDPGPQVFSNVKPAYQGSIEAVAVYQHGLCSTMVNFAGLLAAIGDSLWANFARGVDNPKQVYTHATSILEQDKPLSGVPGYQDKPLAQEPGYAVGGFVLTFHYWGQKYLVGNEVWGTYRYLLSLQDGVLSIDTVVSPNSKLPAVGGGLYSSGIYGSAIQSALKQAMEHGIPDGVHAAALSKQVLNTFPFTCTDLTNCATQSNGPAYSITKDALSAAGVANPTDDEVVHLKCAVGSSTACATLNRDPQITQHWKCTTPPSMNTTCGFFVPAKRLNVLEDELELVWFDGDEFDNPAFGIAVAFGTSVTQALCTSKPIQVGTPPFHFWRGFATRGFGP